MGHDAVNFVQVSIPKFAGNNCSSYSTNNARQGMRQNAC